MSKILVVFSPKDYDFVNNLSNGLQESGHTIIISDHSGPLKDDYFNNDLKQSEVILALITEKSSDSEYFLSEMNAARSYAEAAKNVLFIPILYGETFSSTAFDSINRRKISFFIESEGDIGKTIRDINSAISVFKGHLAAKEEEQEKIDKEAQTNLSDFVIEAISSQQKSEAIYNKAAKRWYIVGYVSLSVGLLTTVYLASLVITANSTTSDYARTISTSLLNIVAIAILAALSKYAYSLGKSYMSEALKCSDRIHAIQFGKFFLKAYGEKANSSDIKEVFQHWNIDRNSTFSSLDSAQIDPKIVTMVVDIVSAVTGKKG